MSKAVCEDSPPSRPVKWVLEHNNGAIAMIVAQTAFKAAQGVGWAMSEVRKFAHDETP